MSWTDAKASETRQGAKWCRISLVIGLVQPAPGQILCVDRKPRFLRVRVCAPPAMLITLGMALVGQQPWAGEVLRWLQMWLGPGG